MSSPTPSISASQLSQTVPLRALITGCQGQVGHALVRHLPESAAAVTFDRQSLDLSDLDHLADHLHTAIETHRPTVLINAAAYTAVDRAESEPTLAFDVNALAPGIMATVAAAWQIPMVHYSTDYVFDGTGTAPYTENDIPNPASVYGRSKLAGERAVIAANGPHLIFRTSWVFGAHGQNFLQTMLRLALERDALKVVNDQIGAPTSADLIAELTLTILQTMLGQPTDDPRWGLYHLSADGHTSWHGYAAYLIEQARALGWPIRLSAADVQGIPSSDYPTDAARPMNSRLSTQKLQVAFGVKPSHWQAGVNETLSRLREIS